MSESMRGMRLGSQSLESDVGIELSARQLVSFRCPNQHQFNLVFAENVELPELWQCQQCQALATRMIDGERSWCANRKKKTVFDLTMTW